MAEIQLYFHHLSYPAQVTLQAHPESIEIQKVERSELVQNYQKLDAIAARLLRLLGLLVSDRFTGFLATKLLESDAELAIAQLVQFKFVHLIAADYYQLSHRSFARQQLGLEESMLERQSARLRICQAYLELLESDTPKELAWFEQERSNLFASLEWSQQIQNWEIFVRFVETIARFLDECGDRNLGQALSQQALKTVNEPIHEAMLLNNLANFELRQRSWNAAESNYTQSLSIFRQLEDAIRIAQTSVNLGILAIEQKRWGHAIQHWKIALSQLPSDHSELQTIQQRMFSIDPNLLESAGGQFRPNSQGLWSNLKENLRRFILD